MKRVPYSYWTSCLVCTALGLAFVYYSGREQPFVEWSAFVFHSPAGIALYAVLMLNLTAITLRRLIEIRGGAPPEEIGKMDDSAEIPGEGAYGRALEWASRGGFRPREENGGVIAVKNRFSHIPGTVLRIGIIVFMAALLASTYLREQDVKVLHIGEAIDGHLLKRVAADLPEDFLQVGQRSAFELPGAYADLDSVRVDSGYPTRIGRRYYRLLNIGYSLPVSVKSSGDMSALTADLDLLPPGKTDVLSFPKQDLIVSFALKPEKTIKKGLLKGELYNTKSPTFHVSVQSGRNKTVLGSADPGPGKEALIGNISVSLRASGVFARIASVRDPAMFWLYAGVLITILGLILMCSRPFYYSRRFRAVKTDTGALVGISEEFYKRWAVSRFRAEMAAVAPETESTHGPAPESPVNEP